MDILREFVCEDPREYRFRIGKKVGSALSGFIAGAIAASTAWITGIYLWKLLLRYLFGIVT